MPVLYQAALRHSGVHALEHAMFLGFGINMWMCLFGPLPTPSWFGNLGKLIYIVAVRLAGTVLGNVFLWSGTIFYPYYLSGDAHFHISPLADQSIAGAIMMVEESILTLGLFCWLFLRTARESEERQELLDYANARGLELSDARAARAVAAGRGGELRQRLQAGARAAALPEQEPLRWGHVRRLRDGGGVRRERFQDVDAEPQHPVAHATSDATPDDRRDVCRRPRLDNRLQRLDARDRARCPRDRATSQLISLTTR